MVTLKDILEAVQALRETVEAWQRAIPPAIPLVEWRGMQRKAVSEEVQQAADLLFELVATQDIEPTLDCRRLVLAIDDFDKVFCDWAEACQRIPDKTDPSGTADVWAAYQRMLDAKLPKIFRHPEPIGALQALKPPATPAQIAKIYGWYLPSGQPDIDKVQEEITTPGTHYNPKTWIHPGYVKEKAENDALWQQRAAKPTNGHARREAAEAARGPREAPESIDELITHGINARQIAKMKRVTEEQVRERAAELGIPLDGNLVSAFYRQTKTQEDEEEIKRRAETMRVATFNAHEELGNDLAGRVTAMAADGVTAGDIVKALANAFPGLNQQRVVKIRDGAKKEKAAAAG